MYRFMKKPRSWADAKAAAESVTCVGVTGHLVNIGSAEENEFVHGLAQGASVWTGGHRQHESPHWEWSDENEYHTGINEGENVEGMYNNWDSGEPNNNHDNTGADEECMYLYGKQSATWNDANCDLSLAAVVEFDGEWDLPADLSFRAKADVVQSAMASESSLQPRFERLRRKLAPSSHRRGHNK